LQPCNLATLQPCNLGIRLLAGLLFIAFMVTSCTKDTGGNEKSTPLQELHVATKERIDEINDFVERVSKEVDTRAVLPSRSFSTELEMAKLVEDVVNYQYGHNPVLFSNFVKVEKNISLNLNNDILDTGDSDILYYLVTKQISDTFKIIVSNYKRFALLELEILERKASTLDLKATILFGTELSEVEHGTGTSELPRKRIFYFKEYDYMESHHGEDFLPENCSYYCNSSDCSFTSKQICQKGFDNYWHLQDLLCCGTWLSIETLPLTSDYYNTYPRYVSGWWFGLRYQEPPCLNNLQLNSYVNVTTDHLISVENYKQKKCFYLAGYDGNHYYPIQDQRYVWNGLSKWGKFVVNNPPDVFPDVQ